MEKSRAEERPWLKKTKQKKILSRKETNSFVKATGTGGAPRWRPDFKQRSRRQTKICHT